METVKPVEGTESVGPICWIAAVFLGVVATVVSSITTVFWPEATPTAILMLSPVWLICMAPYGDWVGELIWEDPPLWWEASDFRFAWLTLLAMGCLTGAGWGPEYIGRWFGLGV